MNLNCFKEINLFNAGTSFFKQLNIRLNSSSTSSLPLKSILKDKFKSQEIFEKVSAAYFLGLVDKSVFDDNLSLSKDKKISYEQADKKIHDKYEGMMIFAVQIDEIASPTRTQLSDLTRAFNRASQSLPVVVLFQYGNFITLATSKRTKYKQTWREGEKIGKISLLKDIDTLDPHTGHIKILDDLALKPGVRDFSGLYQQWREVFDVQLLNRNFYKELSSWYFWAVENAEFPDDAEKNREIRNALSIIRLLTRLIFVWFVKEKGLIPDKLFDRSKLDNILNYKDSNDSSFYKAILQNLFFATLNQEQSKRPFRRNGQNYNVTNLYRYKKLFKIDEIKILDLFKNIPFLNGGLFECLDKPHSTRKGPHGGDIIIRIDGFSDRDDNVLKVPDYLFFDEERDIDLNEVFGTKNKKYKVKGLINLLNKYKFTIAENTPIEEEIALDPELLGKVFENLLASYNPETKTTARKQTGSFYTPREIVDYMVDESLKASLSNLVSKKIDKVSEEDIQTGLEILFAYTEEEHAFTKTEVSKIIEAVSELKILDPACGSGAFPMGILHKLVFILSKLDEDNKIWRELQKQKALKETETAYNLGNKDERHQRLTEIEKAFDFNTSDYGRKLFLIENSIYGVDIQPIAVQIAKLRFFISLIVDQDVDKTKENLGILPLPNLETKFVAANTLIGVDKPDQGNFADLKTKDLENELLIIRHKHFNAKTQKTKKQYREKDKKIRYEIARVLKKSGWPSDTAEMLATWDPYDQNASAPFFDPEWMYGITDGFDTVIGNPPYMGFRDMDKILKRSLQKEYQTATAKFDLYVPFIERGLQLTAMNAHLIYICPTAFTKRGHGKAVRKYILANAHAKALVDFEHDQMFGEATNYTGVLLLQRRMPRSDLILQYRQGINSTPINIRQGILGEDIWIFVSPIEQILVDHVRKDTVSLGDIADISEGIVTGLNKFYLQTGVALSGKFGHQLFHPCLRGREIHRFQHNQCSEFVFYPYESHSGRTVAIEENEVKKRNTSFYKYIAPHREEIMSREYFAKSNKKWFELWNQRKIENFKGLRILTPELSDTNRFCIADDGFFYGDTVCGIKPKPPYDNDMFVKFLLGVLNSQLLEWFYKKTTVPKAGGFFIYKVMFLRNLPICIPKMHLQEKIAKQVELCVDYAKAGVHSQMKSSELEINKLVVEAYEINTEVLKTLEKN